jgi:glutamine amidotransferase
MIVIVDYDAGNVGSVQNIVRKAGGEAVVSGDPATVAAADKIILPGVGHFSKAMERLAARGLTTALGEAVIARRVPFLGICLGMQLIGQHSEEGDCKGLGWIPARVVKFVSEPAHQILVPHMCWNTITVRRPEPLLEGLPSDSRFYFVHSYHMVCDEENDEVATSCHGRDFTAVVRCGNICGMQFHPEKSHKFGLQIMKRFVSAETPCAARV